MRTPTRLPDADGMLPCRKCGERKPAPEFYKRADGRPHSYCKPCKRALNKTLPESSWESIVARFWPKVDKNGPNGCWVWTGGKMSRGRGQLYVGGKLVMDSAHRISLRIHGVEVPDPSTGLVVDHMCKRAACVNPAHLRIIPQDLNCCDYAPDSPFHKNRAKSECVHGHPLSGSNLAIYAYKGRRAHRPTETRICLTCNPDKWMYSVEKRDPPPGARKPWVGPFHDPYKRRYE